MNESLTIICVHGVGLWPGLFGALQFGGNEVSVTRPGYGSVPSVSGFAGQVEVLADVVSSQAPAVLVGVSGGATLALACAVEGVDGLVAAVTHEPLVGQLEPELDERIREAAAHLEDVNDLAQSTSFLCNLYGRASWEAMPEDARVWARAHTEVVCREVRDFTEFQPSDEELRGLPVPHLTTVGQRSSPERHRIVDLLGDGGSETATIDGSGHHVLTDQPAAFSAAVRLFISRTG